MNISTTFASDPRFVELTYSVLGNELAVTFQDLDSYMKESLNLSILYGVAIGAAIILLFFNWVSVKAKRTPMFVLNQLSLILLIVKSALYLTYLLGPLASLAFSFTGMLIPDTYSSYRVTVASNVIHTLLIATIEASLCYQVFIVFCSPSDRKLGMILTLIFAVISLTTVAFYIYTTTNTAIMYQQLFSQTQNVNRAGTWANNIQFIFFATSINLISCILIMKLVLAIRTRRYLGLKQFDSFHMLTLISTQVMIIPSILVIVNYKSDQYSSTTLANISVLIIVLLLPFSSMWSASANNNSLPTSSSLRFLSNSPTDSDNETIANSFSSIFPLKLRPLKANATLESAGCLPTTLKHDSLPSLRSFGLDIEKILYDTELQSMQLDDESLDEILHDAAEHDFIAKTAHTKKYVNDKI